MFRPTTKIAISRRDSMLTAVSWQDEDTTAATNNVTAMYDTATVDNRTGRVTIDNDWISGHVNLLKKRRRFLGRSTDESPEKAVAFFDLIKKNLKPAQEKKFKELAEKAFEEALKYEKIGQKTVVGDLEVEINKNLKLAAIQVSDYNKIVVKKQVDEYCEHLPKNKELIVDDLEEFGKPIPGSVLENVEKAKECKIFDSYCVFWIREVKDPIIFGQIKEESEKYFFIDEWDDDISVEDLLEYDA